jgi:hypothetical protein
VIHRPTSDGGDLPLRLLKFARAERAHAVAGAGGIHLAKDYHTGLGHVEQFRRGFLSNAFPSPEAELSDRLPTSGL